jgi:histidyl-tRNA synthetase
LGGVDTPAVGGALGVERTLAILKERQKTADTSAVPRSRVFLVQLGDKAKKEGLRMIEEFRKAGIPVREALGRESITAQLKVANKVSAELTIILGQKEVLDNVVIIREMDTGVQETIPADKLMNEIKKRLKKRRKK